MSVTKAYEKEMLKIFDDFAKKRVEKGISARIIAMKSPLTMYLKLHEKEFLREIRLVTSKKFPHVNSEINICANCMHSMSIDPRGAFAVIIEDKNMVNIQKAAFELAWKETEVESAKIEKEIHSQGAQEILKKIEEMKKTE
jgi:hypothetical protein